MGQLFRKMFEGEGLQHWRNYKFTQFGGCVKQKKSPFLMTFLLL